MPVYVSNFGNLFSLKPLTMFLYRFTLDFTVVSQLFYLLNEVFFFFVLLHAVYLYLEVDQSKLPCSLFAYGSFLAGSNFSCMPFPANASVIFIKLTLRLNFLVLHSKLPSFLLPWPISVIIYL